jgi:hypothetical protein
MVQTRDKLRKLLSATRPNLIYIVIQREEEVQHMVQTRDKLNKAVERYKA